MTIDSVINVTDRHTDRHVAIVAAMLTQCAVGSKVSEGAEA